MGVPPARAQNAHATPGTAVVKDEGLPRPGHRGAAAHTIPVVGGREPEQPLAPWRERVHEIIFEAETPAGKRFDVVLLWAIVLSVVAVMLESVEAYRRDYGTALRAVEWGFTLLFTVEYVLRLLCIRRPVLYARSFFGLVDLCAILPTYLSVFVPGAQTLLVIRGLRLLRIFRLFKLARYVGEAAVLTDALRKSRFKIVVFVGGVLTLVVILGAFMYMIEGPERGFTSVPRAVYWAIVTLTTVGYGDVSPQTLPGQILAAVVMIMGYGIIAVPTGIVTGELVQAAQRHVSTRACRSCSHEGHDADADFCKFCGAELAEENRQAAQ